ncbi:MAG: hypothetical protein AB8I08_27195 [Sandaracinaceae bacterium]
MHIYPRFIRLGLVQSVSELDVSARDQFVQLMNEWGLGCVVIHGISRWRLERSSSREDDLDVWFLGMGRGAVFSRGTSNAVALIERFELKGTENDGSLARHLRTAQLATHLANPEFDDEICLAP